MNLTTPSLLAFCVVFSTGAGLDSCCSIPSAASLTDSEAFFQSEVKPIFEMNCLACHQGASPEGPGRLNLSTRETTLAGRSKTGLPYLTPGQPEKSLLFTAVSRRGTHPKLMPQRDLSLTEDDIGTLREWIMEGAAWPDGPHGTLHPKANPEIP